MDSYIRIQPVYCEYSAGPCDQSYSDEKTKKAMFLYPANPPQIASAIENAVKILELKQKEHVWLTWKDICIAGQVIYCSICKSMRFADIIVCDVTTLNFNLLFEIGYALGLQLPVIPIRDSSYVKDKLTFDELGLLDTVGYKDFQNSSQLSTAIIESLNVRAIPNPSVEINYDAPLYVVKGPMQTEGEVKLMSELNKSLVRFRAYDAIETPRLSLHEVRKQVTSSLGIIAHLISPERKGAIVHNSRCALIAGYAMALGKTVLMLQEGVTKQPIDYRDVVKSYTNALHVPALSEGIVLRIIGLLQDSKRREYVSPDGLLQNIDIGDVAAENEIKPLRSYFVQTGQYHQAKRGYARLVVGRKGSGKTAIFYAVRDSFGKSNSKLVLDLKPEGHQFTKLREYILSRQTPGIQEHTLTAFWNIILLSELANKIVIDEQSWAQRDSERFANYEKILKIMNICGFTEKGDFSERLLNHVNRLVQKCNEIVGEITASDITRLLYKGDIPELNDALGEYLEEKDEVWVLIDNLDKGWPTQGASTEDILIIKTLLEATRKLQRQLEDRDVNLNCLVFLRNDIYEHLILQTSDKGKDTAITLDWADAELFKEIFNRRVIASGQIKGNFDEVWSTVFEINIGTRDTFSYILERTLMRPRDFLTFIHRAIEVAINRGHAHVLQDDVLQAEKWYSEDMLKNTSFELLDVYPEAADILYAFIGCFVEITKKDVLTCLCEVNIPEEFAENAIKMLAWFGFLGVKISGDSEPTYSYQIRYDMGKLLSPIEKGKGVFVVHPAFRSALECIEK